MTPGLRPFFPYFGGKFRAAPRYPAPQHDWIVEPFAGSAGYAMRYPDRQVMLVEASEPIAAIWQYLILASPREILRLPLLEPGQSVDSLAIPQPARWLIGMWVNPGSAQPKRTMTRWLAQQTDGYNRSNTMCGVGVRERLARQVERIRHWIVRHGDYSTAPNIRATWFVAPPYERAGHNYPHGSRQLDYPGLARWCIRRRGQVLVCEQVGAEWLPFRPYMTAKANAGHNGHGTSAEALWTP